MGVIYLITNQITGKEYIGQTRNSPEIRWKRHLWGADNEDFPLYRAMRKYGKENFSFEILEEIENSELNKKEIFWIKKKNTYVPNGYNCTFGGSGVLKYDESKVIDYYLSHNNNARKTAVFFNAHQVTILNILRRNRIPVSNNYDHLKKKVVQLDLNGNFVELFDYSLPAAKATGINRDSILNSALSRGAITGGGYLWIYEEDYDKNTKYGKSNSCWKPVRCFEEGLEFKSISEACLWLKDNNKNLKGSIHGMNSNINRAIKNNIRAYGYHWVKI